jgi:hypothetical protein
MQRHQEGFTEPEFEANANLEVYPAAITVVRLLKKSILLPDTTAVIPDPEPVWCVLILFKVLIKLAHCVAVTTPPVLTWLIAVCPYPALPEPVAHTVLIRLVVLPVSVPIRLL